MLKDIYGEIFKSPLFEGIDEEELDILLHCLKPRLEEYNKNEYIVLAGNEFSCLGIVVQGEASLVKDNAAGNRAMLTVLKPGDMFGEILIYSENPHWPATIQAQQKCRVLFLEGEQIIGECKKMCPWHRTLIRNMLKIISSKTLLLNRKIEYLTIQSIRQKISTFLLENYRKFDNSTFMIPLNRKELAEFLNVSRPSLSREMCRMRDEGIIDFHMATVKIRDLDGLRESAG